MENDGVGIMCQLWPELLKMARGGQEGEGPVQRERSPEENLQTSHARVCEDESDD